LRELHPTFFASKYNLLLMGSTDGMCPWKDKKLLSGWPFELALGNLPFYMRWRLANVILTSVSHNSVMGQPLNFNTHHRLIAEDLLIGWELGYSIIIAGVAVTVRVMMAFLVGDGPGCDLRVWRHVHVHMCRPCPHIEPFRRSCTRWLPVL